MAEYNHAFDIAFSIDSDKRDPYSLTNREVMDALEKRVRDLKEEIGMDGADKPVGEWADCYDSTAD